MITYELARGDNPVVTLEDSSTPNPQAALLFRNSITRRLVEVAAKQLDLAPADLSTSVPTAESLAGFEVVIADASTARVIRSLFLQRDNKPETVTPALIAVYEPDELSRDEMEAGTFDGTLTLPLDPATLLTQLSVILYAHRAFLRRYQTALEELHLNRKIFCSVSSGITIAKADEPDMPLFYVNPAFEAMTGYSFEEVQGKNCRFLQGGEYDQPGLVLIREAVQAEREVVTVIRNYRKDGTFFWNELSLSPIRNRDGQVTHFVGIQNDVTARVEFESALRESEKLAAVGRLAASIAHEINNPLESVTNLLYLARQSTETNEIKRYLELADTELRRAALITSQSLRFYKQSTRPQPIRPDTMLDSVLDLYRGKIENAEITVERRLRMGGNADSIVCLESEVRQVLSNLVRNAIDAMKGKRGSRLLVRTRKATDGRTGARGVVITVADTGSGISPQTMKRLFTAFFTTKGAAGTGLGLWVSSEIIHRHCGRLLVRSRQREDASWTVFQLFLPFHTFAP